MTSMIKYIKGCIRIYVTMQVFLKYLDLYKSIPVNCPEKPISHHNVITEI